MRVAVSWSGGKDSCFACFKAIQKGLEVSDLLTMTKGDGKSNFHNIRNDLLDAQANALGIPLTKREATSSIYEQEFKRALHQLKNGGVQGLVTGDIFEVPLHEKGWLNRVCKETGLKTIKPLWKRDTTKIFHEFVKSGFEAIVVRVNPEMLSQEWLGRSLNEKFFQDIIEIGNVDPCGERGEYHTLVTDGPLFSSRIEILESIKGTSECPGQLEIKQFEIIEKRRQLDEKDI